MKPSKNSRFRRLILVNWLDCPYAQIELDDNVTILEGGNGSGKSSVLLAALVTLMPDKKQLRSRKVTIEKNVEEAIYFRLEPAEPIAYAALEIQLGTELVLAGVHITKQSESNSIALDPFTIHRWPNRESLQDFFRFTEEDREWTCNLNELKQRAGEWGVEFHAPPTLIGYFKQLYDWGVLPLTMATESERSQYAHLLETSMAGGLSSALVDRLKGYLLPEYEKLPEATKLMHDNLLACIKTQHELELSNEHYTRIASLFRSLTTYLAVVGTRIKREADAANEKLNLTELNLTTVETELESLGKEKEALSIRKARHDAEKQAALSNLQTLIQTKRQEEQTLLAEANKLKESRQQRNNQSLSLITSLDELEKAIAGISEISRCALGSDCTGIVAGQHIGAELERIQEELRQLKQHQQTCEEALKGLQAHQGADPELVKLADKIGAIPVLKRYADLADLEEAARLEAKLGPLVQGLIVTSADKAAQKIARLDTPLSEVWLTTSKDPANEIASESCGAFQKVECGNAYRMTRAPERPVLGGIARKKRVQELEAQIRDAKTGFAELKAVLDTLESLKKHTNRIADEYAERPVSWLRQQVATVQAEISRIGSQISAAEEKAKTVGEELSSATGRINEITTYFKGPEDTLNSEVLRNGNAISIKEPLKKKLEKERVEGIEIHTRLKKAWQTISELPEVRTPPAGDLPDSGAALERLRGALQQIEGKDALLNTMPLAVPEDMTAAASDMLRIRSAVRALIQSIQPHNLTDSNEPEAVIQALTDKIGALTNRFDEQQNAFRNNIDTIADSINAEINKRTQRILRWSNDLKEVQFGTVKGIRLRLERITEQIQILEDLRQQKELFSKSQTDPKTALQEFWKERTGQQLTTENALDYRRFVSLLIEVGDGRGKWRPVGGSTGEMTGAALSVLIILLRAWEEQATAGRDLVVPLRLLFLDEAGRLDPSSQANIEALSSGQSIQLVVAAPAVASSGKFTHYVLARKEVGSTRQVLIRGRRRFCEPASVNSQH